MNLISNSLYIKLYMIDVYVYKNIYEYNLLNKINILRKKTKIKTTELYANKIVRYSTLTAIVFVYLYHIGIYQNAPLLKWSTSKNFLTVLFPHSDWFIVNPGKFQVYFMTFFNCLTFYSRTWR